MDHFTNRLEQMLEDGQFAAPSDIVTYPSTKRCLMSFSGSRGMTYCGNLNCMLKALEATNVVVAGYSCRVHKVRASEKGGMNNE